MNSNIVISGNHVELTDALKNHVIQKMSRLFKHNERIIRLDVELCYKHSRDKQNEFVAKAHIVINGPDIEGSEASNDLYASIDMLVDTMDRQLAKRHEKHKDKRNHPRGIEQDVGLPKVSVA